MCMASADVTSSSTKFLYYFGAHLDQVKQKPAFEHAQNAFEHA